MLQMKSEIYALRTELVSLQAQGLTDEKTIEFLDRLLNLIEDVMNEMERR